MWSKVALLALGTSLLPLGACAQARDDGGPPPEMRAKMDAARGAAKESSLAALTPDHRTKVQALVDAFDASGSTDTVSDTASKIDAILTKDESAAILAQEQKMRDAMRAAFAANAASAAGGGPDGGTPGGGAPGGGPGGDSGGPGGQPGMSGGPGGGGPGGGRGFGDGRNGRRRLPDAGRFLLQVDASQDRYREAMRAERER